ncbi:type VI secretion system protein TssA [Candidatus Paracaedibacter symbiosus]|uniref:type VI secretion system protein TssA n=1 Tax=Candidatus Paracaedibacter symbiosus TaxID=244582 RepID=UPI0005099E76|nr:type VI secretion system protein TssA [Candidatus Paracaedibacter symbiosus]
MVTNYDRQSMGNLKTLLGPLSADNPTGKNLYYETIYDQIKEARREDDPTLSQGVWQVAFKKADWPMVEKLCCQALTSQTKDLQIASWLAEAWITMDQLDGFIKGTALLQGLCESYWESIFPELQEGDNERRLHLLEWLDSAWKNRLVTFPIIENPLNSSSISLADWMHATRLDTVSKRSPDRQKMLKQAELHNELTLERIQQILEVCSKELLENLNLGTAKAFKAYDDFKKSLDTLLKDESRPAMNEVVDTLKELQRFMKTGLDLAASPIEPIATEQEIIPSIPFAIPETTVNQNETAVSATSIPQTRSDAYKMVGDIGDFLQGIEQHSPAPALLKRIAAWENKNISDIFKDFGDTPEDWSAFAKFIGSGPAAK